MIAAKNWVLLANLTIRMTFRFKFDYYKALLLGMLSLLWHGEWGVVGN